MATITLRTANRAEIVQSFIQQTAVCTVAVTAGAPVVHDANGKWIIGKSDAAGNCKKVFVATRSAKAGEPLTAIEIGEMDGFDLSGMAFGDPIYLNDTGVLGTAAGTVSVVVGRVIPAYGQVMGVAPDKIASFRTPG